MTLQTRVPKNFHWCRWGTKQRVKHAQTREQGPPLARAEMFSIKSAHQMSIDSVHLFVLLLVNSCFHMKIYCIHVEERRVVRGLYLRYQGLLGVSGCKLLVDRL